MNRILILFVCIVFLLPVWKSAVEASERQSVNPPRQILLQQNNLEYIGAFRVPRGNLGGASTHPETLSGGGAGLTYNPENNSLIMISRRSESLAVEISIPAPSLQANIASLNTAVVVQVPGDVANSQWSNLTVNGAYIENGGRAGGLLVYNEKLIGSSYAYYDGGYEAFRSHFTASLDWVRSGSKFKGMFQVGVSPNGETTPNGGFVGGYMAHVPGKWQKILGYPALTGKGSLAIISRTSLGPCAWGFNPDNLGNVDPVPAVFLVGYPYAHPTLGTHGGTSLYYNSVTSLNGLAFPEGTDTLLFFGRHGLGMSGSGDTCYGYGVNDKTLHGVPDKDGVTQCYDPVNTSKGVHGYPYITQVWAYDAGELAAVKKGKKQPWDIMPYARWELNLPFATGGHTIEGVAYDPDSQKIFIAQSSSDKISNPYEPYPIIHVFKIKID
jgi:hypothetical protein